MIIPVILAGGSGTRLWPLSRKLYPKQLMNLVDAHTMLQNTMMRLKDFPDMAGPIIICNETHRFMVAEQIREIGIDSAVIILEPVGRNTAPAVAVAALKSLAAKQDPILLVLPADHFIENSSRFHYSLSAGVRFAEQGRLITFGIVPTAPETGYGYIRKGAPIPGPAGQPANPAVTTIDRFVEKPDRKTAEQYVASGEYFWNSGIFMFKASRVLSEMDRHVPEIVSACKTAMTDGREDLDFFRLDQAAFAACPGDSIDYAIMEKTTNGAMVPLDAGWNDLGSWEALWQVGQKDGQQNVLKGDVVIEDVKNSYLHATDRLIAAVGLENHIVVETTDAILISPRERVQDVKRLVDQLMKQKRIETLSHRKDYRPWGCNESIDAAERFQVKRVTVKPGAKISLQKHFHRAEHWIVVKGTARVTKDGEQFILREDQSTYIPVGTPHRLENPGKIPLELIEVRSGSYLGEDDIVRMDDVYGRSDRRDPKPEESGKPNNKKTSRSA
ncbi:MAG: mannose-1-phosphate guanylyltransferase/mannose-6-phosphate isomerase [Thermodesulfobacteriota bacterium]